jgi:hypothetical protein
VSGKEGKKKAQEKIKNEKLQFPCWMKLNIKHSFCCLFFKQLFIFSSVKEWKLFCVTSCDLEIFCIIRAEKLSKHFFILFF